MRVVGDPAFWNVCFLQARTQEFKWLFSYYTILVVTCNKQVRHPFIKNTRRINLSSKYSILDFVWRFFLILLATPFLSRNLNLNIIKVYIFEGSLWIPIAPTFINCFTLCGKLADTFENSRGGSWMLSLSPSNPGLNTMVVHRYSVLRYMTLVWTPWLFIVTVYCDTGPFSCYIVTTEFRNILNIKIPIRQNYCWSETFWGSL